MNKVLVSISLISLLILCGCSRTFTIVKDDTPVNRQNIKILNFSCRTGSSILYLTNSEVLKVEYVSFTQDTLTYFLKFPEEIRTLPINQVRKIVTRDGAGSFLQGIGFGALGLIIGAAAHPVELQGTGLPTEFVIGPAIGLITGFTAGEIIGVDKVFIFVN